MSDFLPDTMATIMPKPRKAQIIIPAELCPWPHELRVAQILALAGHTVEFLPTRSAKTADILLDGIEYEIKSPRTSKANTLEHLIKKALRQSPNIIIDSSRTNGKMIRDGQICDFLVSKVRQYRQIKRMIFVTRTGRIIDIKALVC